MNDNERSQWYVQLTHDERQCYRELREKEKKWIVECENLGCTTLHSPRTEAVTREGSRQKLVLVPANVELPSIDELKVQRDYWFSALSAAAKAQEKQPTIGKRSTTLPTWIGLDGRPCEQRPQYRVKKVVHRINTAAAGAKMSVNEALEYLKKQANDCLTSFANSRKAGQTMRANAQDARYKELAHYIEEAQQQVDTALAEGKSVSAQRLSGAAWKILVYPEHTPAFAMTISTVALLPATEDVVIEHASTRKRSEGREYFDFGTIRLTVTEN